MTLKQFCTLLILTFLTLSPATAQTLPSQEAKEEEQKAQQELERKTLALLDKTIDDAQMLKLAENRALIEATAADLLWTRDEKRARSLFREAANSLGEALSKASAKNSRYDQSFWMTVQLRQQILQMIARRDSQLALDLLHATRQTSSEGSTTNPRMPDQELLLEQSIAAQVAANDPKRALQMAQDSLAKGLTYGIIGLLQRLQQKDGEAATRLAGEIIKKLQTENFTRNREAAFVAVELLRTVLHPREATLSAQPGLPPAKMKPLTLEEQTIRELAEVVATAALNGPSDNLMMIQYILPELEKRVPARSAQLRQRITEVNKALDPEARRWMQLEPLLRNGTTEAILEAAAKAPPEMRTALYSTAAWKLSQTGDLERARQIINDNLSGPERDQFLARIDQQLISRSIEQGKLDEAKQLVARIRSKEARASQLAFLAIGLAKKGERKAAFQLLEEARGLVNRQPENQEEINALLQVVSAYALVEPARAFEIVEPIVDQANEMLAAAALLEKFSAGRGLFKSGEMILQPGLTAVSTLYARYGKELAALASADFDRTESLADRFQRSEARIMARLLIAQGVLSDQLGTGDGYEGYMENRIIIEN